MDGRDRAGVLLAALGLVAAAAALVPDAWLGGSLEWRFGPALAACAVACLAPREGRCGWSGTALALGLYPLLQLTPMPSELWAALSPARAELAPELAEFSIAIRSAISVAPEHTRAMLWLPAGCLAVFALGRGLRSRSERWAVVALWALAAMAVLQALTVVGRYARELRAEAPPGDAFNGSQAAAFLVLGLCAALTLCRLGRGWSTVAAGAAAGLCAVGVLATFSRAGLLTGVAAAALLLGFGSGPSRGVKTAGLALAGALLMAGPAASPRIPERIGGRLSDWSEAGRRMIWVDSLRVADENRLLGSGLGTFPYVFRRSSAYFVRKSVDHAHNDYLETAVELGLPFTLLLLVGIGVTLGRAARRVRGDPGTPESLLALGCLVGVGTVLAHALVAFPLRTPAVAAGTALLLGMAAGPLKASSGGRRALTALAVVAMAAAAFWPRVEPAQAIEAARTSLSAADPSRSRQAYRSAAAENPFAAPAWSGLADLAAQQGDWETAERLRRIADQVEPFTLRTEWPLAQIELRGADPAGGVRRLDRLLVAAPDLLPAAEDLLARYRLSRDSKAR